MNELEKEVEEDDEVEAEDNSLPEDFDVEENEDGSATIIPKVKDEAPSDEDDFYENLAESLSDEEKEKLVTEYLEYVEIDKKAREKRDKQYADAIKRSGLGDDAPGGAEFEGASKVVHPLIAEAAIDFAARAIKELCPPGGPVRTKIEGKVTQQKLLKADRKQRHMNWQLTTQMPEFRSSIEQILTQTPMGGVQYSKMYWWTKARRPKFEFIPLDDIYVPFHAANFYSASRKTHRQRLTQLEFEERVASKLYLEVDLEETDPDPEVESKSEEANDKVEGKSKTEPQEEDDGLRTVYEIDCQLKIEDKYVTGEYKNAPYIMTIDNPTQKMVGLYRNWDQADETRAALDWIVEWPFIPWRGAYAIGLSHLIGTLSGAATGALRALLDSAHINNAPTALKLKGAKIGGQSASINITQIHEIEGAPGTDDVRKIAMPLPFNPPSPVLLELLGMLVETGKGVVRTALDKMPEQSVNTPVGTELSRVEQGLVVYSSIHSRLHESMRRNLAILHRLNANNLEQSKANELPDELKPEDFTDEKSDKLAFQEDYAGEMDVQPVSDPNIFSEMQRTSQSQTIMQMSSLVPEIYDTRKVHKRILQQMKVPDIDEILPEPKKPTDENPASENIQMAFGQPAFVLPDQDHLAHIQVLIDFMQDPMYGKNPAIMAKFTPQAVEHLIQHMLFLYGEEIKLMIEQSAGAAITDMMDDDPGLKKDMSKAVAAASPMALQATKKLLAQAMPVLAEATKYVDSIRPPMPQDPTMVAAQKVQVDAEKIKTEAALGHKKLDTELSKEQLKAQTTAQKTAQEIQSKEKIAGMDGKVELVKNQEDNATAMQIASMRVVTGGSAGNLKNGNSLDQNFETGGLVMPKEEGEDNNG